LIVEPNLFVEELAGAFDVPPDGFSPAIQNIQPPRTIVIDITGKESEILARMKQKTRYNIRLAQKRGVVVAPSQDLVLFHWLMQETGKRDGFGVHSQEYYQKAYDLFHPLGKCELFLASYQGQPIAALMVFAQGNTAWYFYGASSDLYRELMSTYLLQFEAMLWARAKGCSNYDLWGVPDAELEALEDGFLQKKDGLWGVYRFKRGFGGELRRSVDPWQRIYQPLLYPLYRWWIQRREVD
jgi:lipid II:glycine glycyltransferase (peptidoglycan interpeptide bridge formation enzyme)